MRGASATERPAEQPGDDHVGVSPCFFAKETHRRGGSTDERPQNPGHLDTDKGVDHQPRPQHPEVLSVVDYLYDEMVMALGLKLIRISSIKKLKYHIEFFLLNLFKTYCNDPTKVIAYSRARDDFSDKKSIYKRKFGLSFRYSVEKGKGVINFLERQGYIKTD